MGIAGNEKADELADNASSKSAKFKDAEYHPYTYGTYDVAYEKAAAS